jgi:septum formation protein
MKNLFLASQSESRQQILTTAKIPFSVIKQTADESQCDWHMPLRQLLESIAVAKMNCAILPEGKDGDEIFVLTADTMGQDQHGAIYGKPTSREDAIGMIKALRGNGMVGTAFCLDKKKYSQNMWHVEKRIIDFAYARYEFSMPDHWIEQYLEHEPDYMHISGAITVDGYGAQFLESVDGSYGAVTGLPMYELRKALDEIGFYHE